ncbi:membrane protein [Streptomyces sp. NRRL F-6491]|nr:membrane protein [Streptomyces sp. NRRL F-6491]KOX49967.1 membrane protein [Streptomyces sp. NRRL F-6492]
MRRGPRRRPPLVTTDTARPEGGGRAAPGAAPAPARQWPLLTVLCVAGAGLLVVGADAFPQSFRVGTILVGTALLLGAVMRRTVPSVGMLAVRSRFTDMITYGVMGGLIVLLALMVQPGPWLRIPFLEDILHLTVT